MKIDEYNNLNKEIKKLFEQGEVENSFFLQGIICVNLSEAKEDIIKKYGENLFMFLKKQLEQEVKENLENLNNLDLGYYFLGSSFIITSPLSSFKELYSFGLVSIHLNTLQSIYNNILKNYSEKIKVKISIDVSSHTLRKNNFCNSDLFYEIIKISKKPVKDNSTIIMSIVAYEMIIKKLIEEKKIKKEWFKEYNSYENGCYYSCDIIDTDIIDSDIKEKL